MVILPGNALQVERKWRPCFQQASGPTVSVKDKAISGTSRATGEKGPALLDAPQIVHPTPGTKTQTYSFFSKTRGAI